ncbi:hypothetical protein [Marinobacter sp.]|uniref:hypothetical protein n=1 Tax=Marinobacter sp. TaxID=50741 RepID=UPI003565BF7C
MAIIGSSAGLNATADFTLANGSTPGRALVVVAVQDRNPPNISAASFTYKGVTPSGSIGPYDDPGSAARALLLYWSDSDLPEDAGAYSLAYTGSFGATFVAHEISEWDGVTPEDASASLTSGWSAPVNPTFNTNAGAALFIGYIQTANWGATIDDGTSADAEQIVDAATNDYLLGHEQDDSGDQQLIIEDNLRTENAVYVAVGFNVGASGAQEIRKSSTFDIETTLGTITTATLNGVNVFDHISQAGTTVSFAGAATDEITTSGEYDLVLGDGTGTETITVQVNVVGVAPSNNPLQKDGSALASLSNVEVRVTDGENINGAELYYSGTATTDASGNLGNIDLSSTAAADADPVLLHLRTAAGDSIIASETVGLI